MSRDTDDRSQQNALIARRRLTRLLDALPVFSGFCSADGHLAQTRPPTKESFLWALPYFSYSHDSITQIVDLCDRAARGEAVQIERDYRPDRTPSDDRGATGDRLARGLLTLTPVEDEDGLVDELAITLIDCDANGLAEADMFTKTRLARANARIGNLLGMAQTVIEALAFREPRRAQPSARDAMAARLDVLAAVIDPLSDPDAQTLSIGDVVDIGLRAVGSAQRDTRLDLDLGRAELPMDSVPIFVLLLSELASNAVQWGAWKQAGGRVSVEVETIDVAASRVMRLHWIERNGPEVAGAPMPGFGMMLGERLFPQITGGRSALLNQSDGMCWTFEVPLPASDAEAEDASVSTFDGGFTGDDIA